MVAVHGHLPVIWQNAEMGEVFKRIKEANDQTAADLFVKAILPKQVFPS
jgi:hypothetical protein